MLTERQQSAIDAYNEFGSQAKAAEAMGISRRTFRGLYNKGLSAINDTPTGFKTTKVSTDGSGKVTARTHKLAPEITDDSTRETGKIIRRSTLYGADGNVTGEWVIRKPEDVVEEDYASALEKHFVADIKREPNATRPVAASGSSELLPVFLSIDEHIGVHLTAETTDQDYNLDSALELISTKFKTLLSRTPAADTAVLMNLGDIFHANDSMDVTPQSKHPLHSSTTFGNVSDAVIALTRYKVDLLLSKYNYLDIVGVAGNHDVDSSGWLYKCLNIAYENDDRVNVDFASNGVGLYEHGNTMINYHHGDKIKMQALAGACADRYSEAYGRTGFRYIHTGHVHHDKAADTFGGFKWESHRTVAPKDQYSFSHGYVSRQTMKSVVYDAYEGEVARLQTSVY